MVVTSLLILSAMFSQAGGVSSGQDSYEISMKDGERIFASVHSSDLNGRGYKISVLLDAPWLRPSERVRELVRGDIIDTEPERGPMRNRRLEKGWKAHGGTQVETSQGLKWVLQTEKVLSDKADAMAVAWIVEGESTGIESLPVRDSGGDDVAAPGFLQLWGIHLAVGGVAILGMGLIGWWGFIRTDWASL